MRVCVCHFLPLLLPQSSSRISQGRVRHNRAPSAWCPGGTTYLAQADSVVESLCPCVEVHCLFYLILALVLPGKVVGCSPVSSLVGYFSSLERPRAPRSYICPAASLHTNRPTPTGCTVIRYFQKYLVVMCVFEHLNAVLVEARRQHHISQSQS